MAEPSENPHGMACTGRGVQLIESDHRSGGELAEWLRSGLQIRVQEFDSPYSPPINQLYLNINIRQRPFGYRLIRGFYKLTTNKFAYCSKLTCATP